MNPSEDPRDEAEAVQPDLFAAGSPRWREVPAETPNQPDRRAHDAPAEMRDRSGVLDRRTDEHDGDRAIETPGGADLQG
jgi:hypothetical protein